MIDKLCILSSDWFNSSDITLEEVGLLAFPLATKDEKDVF